MNGKQLKNSILQWAIQGKLVPQDPNDEPASVLLERIRKEKAKLVKEKKIKKDRNESIIYRGDDNSYYEKILATSEVKCIDEEIPFEIPTSWSWARLRSLIDIKGGKRLPAGCKLTDNKTAHIYIRVSDMQNGTIVGNDLKYITDDVYNQIQNYTIGKDDLYLTIVGSTIGKAGLVPKMFDNMNLTENAVKLTCISINKYFLLHYVRSEYAQTQFRDNTKQVGQPKLAIFRIANTLVPIPPLTEQAKIVSKIGKILPVIEHYSKVQTNLEELNSSIYKDLKKSILQEAIQGRLVPQITSEGDASVLLQQVEFEKQKLVKEGRLKKKDLVSSTIFRGDDNKYFEKNGKIEKDITNEVPFEIPDTWVWSRLSNLVILLSGRDLEPSQYNSVSNGIPYMTGASNFQNGNLIKNRWTETPVVISILGDLLITCKGTIGEMSFNTIGDIHIARQIMALRSSFVNLKYIQYYLSANIQELQKQANSMIPGISRDTLLNALVPLPPLIEQARIVSKIKQLASIMSR